ncbi:MAG: hypothetical protein IJ274_08475, partial [Lachnospiraceae bacterium]|nr:hypothetical protein [Lachnospiraceae bacterium]
FVCEGSKAPIAVIILLFAGMICGLWLITDARRKWAFIYGIPLVVLFLVVFFGFVSEGMNTVTANATGLRFSVTGHLYECGLGKMYFQWTEQGMPQILGKLLILLMFFFGCNLIAYFMMVVQGTRLFSKGIRRVFCFEGCMIAAACAGLIFTLFTKQQGNSQMYFAMTSFPLATIASLAIGNELGAVNGKLLRKILLGCGCVLFCVSFICYVQIIGPTFREGLEKLRGINTFSQESNSLSYEEMEAYKWIKENTEKDSVCVTNLVLKESQYQSFIVGVCTERQMYMEGWRYVAGYLEQETINQRRECIGDFFDGNAEAYQQVLDAGVDYAIWVKRYSDKQNEWKNSFGVKVFENPSVAVYDLCN